MSPNVHPSPGPTADPVSITPAEHRVLGALCDGSSNRAIAACLVISTRTVEGHISSLLLKTGCNSRTQLVLWALKHSQVPVGSKSTPA